MGGYEDRMMVLEPQFLSQYPQITLAEHDIAEIEKQVGNVLPPQYRSFLTRYGGAYFISGAGFALADGSNRSSAERFYGRMPGSSYDLLDNYEAYRGRIPDDLLAIAEDGGGNQICIGVGSGVRTGKVYYWDHEEEGLPEEYISYDAPSRYQKVHAVAHSFDDFFLSLRTHEESGMV